MLVVLVLMAAVVIVLFIERTLYLHRGQIRSKPFLDGIKNTLERRRLVEALVGLVRDGDAGRYLGKGVQKAVDAIARGRDQVAVGDTVILVRNGGTSMTTDPPTIAARCGLALARVQ